MNSSLVTADRTTHLKVVIVALLAGILVATIGTSARIAGGSALSASPRIETPIPSPSMPQVKPPRSDSVVVV
jgi:hypothetical protein